MSQETDGKYLILIAFDVSGSMIQPFTQSSFSTSRSYTLFSTLTDIINNSSQKQKVHIGATLFGCKNSPTCDFLKFLTQLEINDLPSDVVPVPRHIIEDVENYSLNYIYRLGRLGYNYGACFLTNYLKKLSEDKCREIYNIAIRDESLVRELVDMLPIQTKSAMYAFVIQVAMRAAQFVPNTYFHYRDQINDNYDETVEEEVYYALGKCFQRVNNLYSCDNYDWNQPVNLTVMNGDDIIRLFDEKVNKIGKYSLMHWFRHYIYGMTPMSTAIGECFTKFVTSRNMSHRILFLVTDGESNQGSNPYDTVRQYLELDELKNVIIVSCYFSSENLENPRKLYYKKPPNINTFCEKLFDLSSVLPVDSSGFKKLTDKYGWELPPERVCHLFFQINHPEIIEEFSKVLTDIIDESNPFLSSFSSVFVDIIRSDQLIRQGSISQNGPVCYAYSSSGAIQLSLSRIFSREIPSFQEILDKLFEAWPPVENGRSTFCVLEDQCPKYKLHVNLLRNEQEARLALALGRVCVSTFRLKRSGWNKFHDFFEQNPKGVLKRSDLLQPDGTLGSPNEEEGGHAVILIGANLSALEFLNSWGSQWANNGRFRVKDGDVLQMSFFDIYWTLNDLSKSEKENYERCIKETSEAIQRNDEDSSKFAALYFICPVCENLVRCEGSSTASLSVQCPNCYSNFNPKETKLLRGLYKADAVEEEEKKCLIF